MREITERKVLKSALTQAGLSARQADALLRDGYKCLIGETESENQELRERLDELKALLKFSHASRVRNGRDGPATERKVDALASSVEGDPSP